MPKDKVILDRIKTIALEIGQLTYCSDYPNDNLIKELTNQLDFLLNEYTTIKKVNLA